MLQIITSALSVIAKLAPLAGQAGVVGEIITTLQQIVPVAADLGQSVYPILKNIINQLRKKESGVTPEQWAELDTIEAQIDAAFDKAAAAALAEDAVVKK